MATTTEDNMSLLTDVKYLFTSSIIIGSDVTNLDGDEITGLLISKNYDEDVLPIIKLSVSLSDVLYAKIVKNRLKFKIRLKMQKEIYKKGANKKKKEVFNELFTAYINDARPFIEKGFYNTTTKTSSTDNADGSDAGKVGEKVYDFYLFKENDVNATTKITNIILASCNMTDAAGVLLSSAGVKKLLMEKVDNKTKYSEVLFPPYTTIATMEYLQSQYGLYKYGHLLFFDIDIAYLISRDKKCRAKRKNEYSKVIIKVPKVGGENGKTSGSIDDEKKKTHYIRVMPESVVVDNDSIVNNITEGNKKVLVHPRKDKATKVSTDTEQRGTASYEIVYDKYNNIFIDDIKKQLEEKNIIIQITFESIDVDIISPNKEFILKFDDAAIQKELGGSYRLKNFSYALSKQADQFKMIGQATLVS